MIGGVDTIIGGSVDQDDIDVLLRLLRAGWPSGVCETSDGSTVISMRSAPGNRGLGREFFVYRDKESKASWDKYGLTEDNGDAMVSVTIADDCIALVTGDLTSASGYLATWIPEAIRQIRLRRRLTGSFATSTSAAAE